MGDDFMELWTCQKLITVNHTIDSVPAVIKLDSVAECGSVLAKLREDDIACIELDKQFEQSTGVGQETWYVQIDNVNSGDVVEISYFPYADKKIGEIDESFTTMEIADFDHNVDSMYPMSHFVRRGRITRELGIVFTESGIACKIGHVDVHGVIIRDYANGVSWFAVPENAPRTFYQCEMVVEKEIKWTYAIDCECYWKTEFKGAK